MVTCIWGHQVYTLNVINTMQVVLFAYYYLGLAESMTQNPDFP